MLNHLHTFYEELKRDGVMFCFSGPTSQSVVEGIGQALKREMELAQVGMTTIQRVFSIFVEQMQNVVKYSSDKTPSHSDNGDEMKYGVVIVGRCDNKFYIICGNKAQHSQGEKMLERIRQLQQMDKQALNELYRRMRREGPDRESKGAGLGFIEMFRRASEPLECHLVPMDKDTVFFSIKAIG